MVVLCTLFSVRRVAPRACCPLDALVISTGQFPSVTQDGTWYVCSACEKKTEDRGRHALHVSVETSTAEPLSIDIFLECIFLY